MKTLIFTIVIALSSLSAKSQTEELNDTDSKLLAAYLSGWLDGYVRASHVIELSHKWQIYYANDSTAFVLKLKYNRKTLDYNLNPKRMFAKNHLGLIRYTSWETDPVTIKAINRLK